MAEGAVVDKASDCFPQYFPGTSNHGVGLPLFRPRGSAPAPQVHVSLPPLGHQRDIIRALFQRYHRFDRQMVRRDARQRRVVNIEAG